MATPVDRPRYFSHDGSLLPFDATKEVPANLATYLTRYPPELSTFTKDDEVNNHIRGNFIGLFSGPLSVAFAIFLFSLPDSSLTASQPILGKFPLELARGSLALADRMMVKHPELFIPVRSARCGGGKHQVVQAAVSAIIHQDDKYVHELVSYIPVILREDGDEPPYDEWLWG